MSTSDRRQAAIARIADACEIAAAEVTGTMAVRWLLVCTADGCITNTSEVLDLAPVMVNGRYAWVSVASYLARFGGLP